MSDHENASFDAGARNSGDAGAEPALTRNAGGGWTLRDPAMPLPQGLYHPSREHDSCGVGFIADMHNRKSHDIVMKGLEILKNLDHRGAVGADPKLGDGCGILVQIPHDFFVAKASEAGFELPPARHYGIGQFFLPCHPEGRVRIEAIVNELIDEEGHVLLGWRDVPVDSADLGEAVRDVEPVHRQVFVGRGPGVTDDDDFERRLYVLRKVISGAVYKSSIPGADEYYAVSMSCRTIVYKGQLKPDQVRAPHMTKTPEARSQYQVM